MRRSGETDARPRSALGDGGRGEGAWRASCLTLAFVIDLPRGDDLVEDGGERLVLPDDAGRDERRHDELPLTDVGFHGDPGGKAAGKTGDDVMRRGL